MSTAKRSIPTRYRADLKSKAQIKIPAKKTSWRKVILYVPLCAISGVLLNTYFEINRFDTSIQDILVVHEASSLSSSSTQTAKSNQVLSQNWCDHVKSARADLSPSLRIEVPCDDMKPAKSAIVCMLTDGVSDEKATRIVFTATNYIHGAMALGASLQGRINPEQTHQLLLLRKGFFLDPDDLIRLQSVGWIIGTAPEIPLEKKYLPRFPRYKTTYTKISAIGLSEYDCVLLMDADTLAVGDMQEMMTCNIFSEPQHQVAGTIDLYKGHWHFFNTGSILWKTSSSEMDRVFALTKDSSWMKAFSSDQDFLNNVYPERLNNTANWEIVQGKMKQIPTGKVVDMGWSYNAQTHVEVQDSKFWESKRKDVRILHFTEKKGWQCEERHEPPPSLEDMPTKCDKTIPICFCREGYLYWNALSQAQTAASKRIAESHMQR